MSNITINSLPTANTIDATQDILPIYTASAVATQGINRNTLLGLSSQPLGLTDTQSPTNKTFDNTNVLTIKDGNLTLQNSSATTKQARFSLSGITAGQTRTITLPDYNATIASLAGTETLTNKTLTSPTINTPTITNATISADAVTGYTVSNNGTIYGISVSGGTIGNAALAANAVNTTQITNGAVTTAKVTFDGVGVYNSGNQSITNTTSTALTFDSENFDTNGYHSTSVNTSRITVPTTGYYQVSYGVEFAANVAGRRYSWISRNGTSAERFAEVIALATTGGATHAQSGGVLMYLTAGQYIELYVYQDSGGALNVDGNSTTVGGTVLGVVRVGT